MRTRHDQTGNFFRDASCRVGDTTGNNISISITLRLLGQLFVSPAQMEDEMIRSQMTEMIKNPAYKAKVLELKELFDKNSGKEQSALAIWILFVRMDLFDVPK